MDAVPQGDLTKSDMIFSTLPAELRVEIFLQACGTYCPIGQLDEGPVLLLRVCRSWRDFVLQTPHLWTSFSLDFRPLPHPDKALHLVSALEQWLLRSRALPLSFEVHSVLDVSCAALIDILLPTAGRWRDVLLHAPSSSLRQLWQTPRGSFPALRTFCVETFGFAPFSIRDLAIDWGQLTRLDLSVPIPTLDDCLAVLSQGVRLRQCNINAVCIFKSTTTRVALPLLEELQIKLYGGESTGTSAASPELKFLAFLQTFQLDGLKSLSLIWNLTQPPPGTQYFQDATGLVHILHSLGSHLESLHLGYLPSTLIQALECLSAVPKVKHLSISLLLAVRESDFITDEFLQALTLGLAEQPALLPWLQTIRLSSYGESFSNRSLFRFIASRWRFQLPLSDDHTLERVLFYSTRRHAEYHPMHFRDLQEGSLDVAARLKSEFAMLSAIASFLDTELDICFSNRDMPSSLRSSLIFM